MVDRQGRGKPKYALTQWDEYRAKVQAYGNQIMEEYKQQAAAATAAGQDVPPPPTLPEPLPAIPPVFVTDLMPEMAEKKGDFPAAMHEVFDDYEKTLKWLKDLRNPKEMMWAEAEAYYNMAEELSYDDNRRKSIEMLEKFKPHKEFSPERMSLVLPLVYEAVQLIGAHLYLAMRGQGPKYCEVLGRNAGDIENAKRVSEFLNYQYSYEIPSEDIYSDLWLDCLRLGTGVLFQSWDTANNTRRLTALERYNVWWDKAPTLQECKVVNVRREVSVGELYTMRENNEIWFEDKDMDSAAGKHVADTKPELFPDTNQRDMSTSMARKVQHDINPKYQKVVLDITMHTEPYRWVYTVNEELVVAVIHPIIPDIPEYRDAGIKPVFPLTVYAPIRRRGEIDGDSFVARILDVQDMSDSTLELLTENLKAANIGIGLTNDPSIAGQPLKAGEWNLVGDPSNTKIEYTKVNSQEILSVIDWMVSRVTDRITGATPEFRGQAQYAGMTATATRDLMNQSTTRMMPILDRILASMQESFELAITLNRLYLDQHKYFLVAGEDAIPSTPAAGLPQRGIVGADIQGVAGKDLIPTGSPGGAGDLVQKAMNMAAVIMQTGHDPTPLLRLAIEHDYAFKGRVDIDEIFPRNGIGNDPLQENENILSGRPVRRDPDDVDQHHMQVHALLGQDVRFQQVIQANPMIAQMAQMHMQAHFEALQGRAAMLAGIKSSQGFGSGVGASGQNLGMPTAKPKTDVEREAQMEAQNGAALGK